MSDVTLMRTRSRYGAHMVTGTRALMYANVRQGADFEVMWCNESGPSSVYEFRASGWQIVHPKDVEMLDYGQDLPLEKDFGVFVEVDKKLDRVKSPLSDSKGMHTVLMCMPGSRRRQIRADEAVMMDRNTKKLAAPENLNYGAGEATMTTEVSQQTENIKVGEPGSGG